MGSEIYKNSSFPVILSMIFVISQYKSKFLLRYFYLQYKKYKMSKKINNLKLLKKFEHLSESELQIYFNLRIERLKPSFRSSIREEYMEKIIMYGYIVVKLRLFK